MTDIQTPEARVIADLAIESVAAEVLTPDRVEVLGVTVPDGAQHKVIDLEQYLDTPRRQKGTVAAQTVGAFNRYLERHDQPAATTVWVDTTRHRVLGVINDHQGDGDAGWADHRVELELRQTDAWKHWLKLDGKLVDQEAFAEHIEDGLIDIVRPDGATMLEIAQSIQGSTTAEFKQARRLQDGQVKVEYVEQQSARAGQKGDLEIPDRFDLGIAPFLGEDAYKVTARLRYRVRGGTLHLGYKLDRPQDVLETALEGISDRLSAQFGADRVFIGVPRSA